MTGCDTESSSSSTDDMGAVGGMGGEGGTGGTGAVGGEGGEGGMGGGGMGGEGGEGGGGEAECGDSTVLEFNLADGSITGDLDPTDNLSGSCGGEDPGADAIVKFTPEADGYYRFTTAGTGYATVLYALRDCNSGFTEEACDADADEDGTSSVVVTGTVGQPIYLAVDALSGTASQAFTLTGESIEATAPVIEGGTVGLDPVRGGIGVNITGTDPENDIVSYIITFKAADGSDVAALESPIDNEGLADAVTFTQADGAWTYSLLGYFDPAIAQASVGVEAVFIDSTGLQSEAVQIAAVAPSAEERGAECDDIFAGCAEIDACVFNDDGEGLCTEANAPVITAGQAWTNAESNLIGIAVEGTDAESNPAFLRVLPLNAEGAPIDIGQDGVAEPQGFGFDWLINGEEGAFTGRSVGFYLRLDVCLAPAQAAFDACAEAGGEQNACIDEANALITTCSSELLGDIASLQVWGVDETNKVSAEPFVIDMVAPAAAVEAGAICDTQNATAICPDMLYCFSLAQDTAPTCAEAVAACPDDWAAVNLNDHPNDANGFMYAGDNTEATSHGAASCGGGGPQDVITFTAPRAGNWQFTTDGSDGANVDTLIFAREFCVVGTSELSCNDDIDTDGGNYNSILVIELEEGQSTTIFVDSYNGGFPGAYSLQASQL
jgi:hypothetical protein